MSLPLFIIFSSFLLIVFTSSVDCSAQFYTTCSLSQNLVAPIAASASSPDFHLSSTHPDPNPNNNGAQCGQCYSFNDTAPTNAHITDYIRTPSTLPTTTYLLNSISALYAYPNYVVRIYTTQDCTAGIAGTYPTGYYSLCNNVYDDNIQSMQICNAYTITPCPSFSACSLICGPGYSCQNDPYTCTQSCQSNQIPGTQPTTQQCTGDAMSSNCTVGVDDRVSSSGGLSKSAIMSVIIVIAVLVVLSLGARVFVHIRHQRRREQAQLDRRSSVQTFPSSSSSSGHHQESKSIEIAPMRLIDED